MAEFTRRPPAWFRVVAAVLLVWNLIGAYACVQQFRLGAAAMGPPTAADLKVYATLPGWYNWLFAAIEVTGISGAVALLAGRAAARPLFVFSMIGVVIQFGYYLLATDIIALQGIWVTYFPLFVIGVCLLQVWLAGFAVRRGWLI